MDIEFLKFRAKVRRENIVFLHWIIESYEGTAIMRTIDSAEGLVEFWVLNCFKEDFFEVISSLHEYVDLLETEGRHAGI